PVETIKRIEIIRGPGSALYGTDAFFGVVNIITKEGGDKSLLNTLSWVPGGSEIEFTGLKLVYNGTQFFKRDYGADSIYPTNDLFKVVAESNLGFKSEDASSSGRNFSIPIEVGEKPLQVDYTLYQEGIPSSKMINEIPGFSVKVDTDTPTEPPGIQVHADDFDDPNTVVDNDGELFVTWRTPGEYRSGIAYYEVRVNGDDGSIITTPTTFAKIETTESGRIDVEVRATDRVDHTGEWAGNYIYIDKETLEFTSPFPAEDQWFNILDPEVGVTITDIGGRAVIGNTVEYTVSYDGGENWGQWISADVVLNAPSFTVTIEPTLMEGSANLVKFRAGDEAGNMVESEPQQVNIDISGVDFGMLMVGGSEDWELSWLEEGTVDLGITVMDELSGVNPDTVEYRMTTRGRLDVNSAPWQKIPDLNGGKSIDILMEDVELAKGDGNFIQFRARDILDNAFSYTELYNIWVNTEPVPVITSPEDGAEYMEGDMVIFDASDSWDYDGDQLTYTWTDTIDGETTVIGEGTILDFEKFEFSDLAPGMHTIQLTASDGLHEVLGPMVEVFVEDYIEPIWLYEIDTDGDGMPNYWEYNYHLDWESSANGDSWYSAASHGQKSKDELWKENKELYEGGQVQVSTQNDFDGDGHSDFEEYLVGTDPTREDQFPIYVKDDVKGAEDETDIFLIGLIIAAVVMLVFVLIFLVVNNVITKAKVEEEAAKAPEIEQALMNEALSAGGLERLAALKSASEGKPVALAPAQEMSSALPAAPMDAAPVEGRAPQPMAAQPMAAQPMDQVYQQDQYQQQ
ncbi:MAG: hypothetical protein ACMUIE_09475, partial [Thermoplasmatota archaeon]